MGTFVQVKKEYEDDVYGNSINAPLVLYSTDDEDIKLSNDTKKEEHVNHALQPISHHEATPIPSPEPLPRAINKLGTTNSQNERHISRLPQSTAAVKPSRKMRLALNIIFNPELHERNIPKVS